MSCSSDFKAINCLKLAIGTPKEVPIEKSFFSLSVRATSYSAAIFSSTAILSSGLSKSRNTCPFGDMRIDKTFCSGIFISETDPGVFTCTGSFFKNVEVSMKNVSKSTVTSLIAVISMNVDFLFTFIFGIIVYFFYK
ncbi:conserved hypothetical protein [uncultured Paludibacter sp.]|nr:conserved hypothetical protein [uncultured Paludibacter sp.]